MDSQAFGSGAALPAHRRWLCLEFTNTVDWHASDHPADRLAGYADLIAWSRRAGTLTVGQAQTLLMRAASAPGEAEQAFERAVALREALYRIFAAVAHERQPEALDLAVSNEALARALAQARVSPAAHGFEWTWAGGDALDRPFWPIARSAAELLTSADLRRVGQCADDRGCGWLFVDTSRARTRRWCAMRDCGNRAKARRHHARQARRAPVLLGGR